MIQSKAKVVLKFARELAPQVGSWADFSAALFDQSTGMVARTFP